MCVRTFTNIEYRLTSMPISLLYFYFFFSFISLVYIDQKYNYFHTSYIIHSIQTDHIVHIKTSLIRQDI